MDFIAEMDLHNTKANGGVSVQVAERLFRFPSPS